MKNFFGILLLTAALGISACDMFLKSDAAGETGTLSIGFGETGARAVSAEELAALHYNLTLTGPDNKTITVTLSAGETFTEQVALGEWRIDAEAYTPEDTLFGAGGTTVTVKAGNNPVRVPMTVIWRFGITISGPFDQMVSISCVNSNAGRNPQSDISFSAGETLTFTVDDSSYTQEDGNLKWYVNGTEKTGTGSSLAIAAVNYIKRTYTLTAMILKDGLWYSGQTSFTVID
jgi:hypothetical protein